MYPDPSKHQLYRNSGNTLVVTLITLSAGLLLWNVNLLNEITKHELILVIVGDVILVICIIFSLLALLSHYEGYKGEARSSGEHPTTSSATRWFDKADWLVPWALYIFFAAMLINIILLISIKI